MINKLKKKNIYKRILKQNKKKTEQCANGCDKKQTNKAL